MFLDKNNMYRLPWSLNDCPIGWVEVTDVCNIQCEGCYRLNYEGHKPLEEIKEEILLLKKWRNCDCIALAGGEAILHPNILDILQFITENRMKSMILTNGAALTNQLLKDMKKAGLNRISFHIDSLQVRPEYNMKKKTESEINDLRYKYAEMVHKLGGITTSFGITVNKDNYEEIPMFVQWAINNIKLVNAIKFVTYRGIPVKEGIEYYVQWKKIDIRPDSLGYTIDEGEIEKIGITSKDVYDIIKEHFPHYEANSYLGGTTDHTSLKWLIGNIIVNSKGKTFGSCGKRTMELMQIVHHLMYGSYMLFTRREKNGKKVFLIALLDKSVRNALFRFVKYVLLNPMRFFTPLNVLGVGIVQAPDILPDGRCDICESCPDLCVYKGKFVSSCRLDEYKKFGDLLQARIVSNNEKGHQSKEN